MARISFGRVPSHIVLNSMSQRLVLAHVACEATHPRRSALGNSGSNTRAIGPCIRGKHIKSSPAAPTTTPTRSGATPTTKGATSTSASAKSTIGLGIGG
jgi:hypothetical protein